MSFEMPLTMVLKTPSIVGKKEKNEIGTIRLEAFHESNYVVIEISDDGRGIDIGQVKQRAVEKEFVTAEEASEMNEEELLTLIMRPGFSTAAEVTHTSRCGYGCCQG
jgi:two-component system chemotaxis sensor kinase CheA